MSTVQTDQYAICLTCGVEHVDRAAMNQHGRDTLAPTGEQGVTARGHRSRVVNPTPEEVVENRARSTVDRAVEDALSEAFEDLDRSIRRGDVSEEAVTRALRNYPDFADGWTEWLADGAA
jgi:hypothetical protein